MGSSIFIIFCLVLIAKTVDLNVDLRRTNYSKRSHNNYPVILIPGLFGSRIYGKLHQGPDVPKNCPDRSKFHLVWVSLKDFIPPNCFFHWFKLKYNQTTKQMENNAGAELSASFFGHLNTVSTIDDTSFGIMGYYKKIISFLKSKGYNNLKDLYGAPYDFRRLPMKSDRNSYFHALKSTIEEAYEKNGKKVILITHSMGSALTNWFLSERDQHWKDTHIKSWVSINGALAGSLKAFLSRTYGHSDIAPAKLLLGFDKIQNLLETFPSFSYLSSSKSYFGEDRILAYVNQERYTIKNISKIESKVMGKVYDQIKSLKIRDIWIDKPVNVPFHCIYSSGVQTITGLSINEDYTLDEDGFYYGDGDGTLTKQELRSCEAIAHNNKNYPSKVTRLRGIKHHAVLKDKQTLLVLKDYFKNL